MLRRGRSRSVSQAALARRASEERRTYPMPLAAPVPLQPRPSFLPARSSSPSPASTATSSSSLSYYDSPPSPPRTLSDQVHVAYALDDLHLARILLLRLKGIEVTDDNDPRIAQVKDEDFDVCFVPSGPLVLDINREHKVKEARLQAEDAWEAEKRREKLRQCERIWEREKRKLREQKERAQRQREQEEADRAAQAQERIRIAREMAQWEEERQLRQVRLNPKRRPLYKPIPVPVYSPPERTFEYPFMPLPSRSPRPARPFSASISPSLLPAPDSSANISFQDVLTSMHGPLFPPEPHSTTRTYVHTRSRSSATLSQVNLERLRREQELLDHLLRVVEWEGGERRRLKGKSKEKERGSSTKSYFSCVNRGRGTQLQETCAACLIAPTSPNGTNSSFSSRASSWLSFGSSRSVSTAATSPGPSSWFKSTLSSSPPSTSALPNATQPTAKAPAPRCKCTLSSSRLVSIPLASAPLTIPLSQRRPRIQSSEPFISPSKPLLSASAPATDEACVSCGDAPHEGTIVRRMARFFTLARGLQTAYMHAAMFSVSAGGNYEERRWDSGIPPRKRLRPSGYRVNRADVATLLAASPSASTSQLPSDADSYATTTDPPAPVYIQLTSPFPAPFPPRTVLPSPPPYTLTFKPHPPLTRSPFRFFFNPHVPSPSPSPQSPPNTPSYAAHAYSYSPAAETSSIVVRRTRGWRLRPVGNPVHLRLKALGNVLSERGWNWEGRGQEGGLGCGREKLVGIAIVGGGSCLAVGVA